MDPFNPNDPNLLGPDGLPLKPHRPPPQNPPPEQDAGTLYSDGMDAGIDAVDGIDVVTDGGIIGGIGDLMTGAVDLAGSAISGTADVMSGVASGAVDVAGSVASGAVDVLGTVASGAGEVLSTVASNIPDVVSGAAEGIGQVVEGAGSAADGCGSCSLAIVFFLAAAGSASAAVLR